LLILRSADCRLLLYLNCLIRWGEQILINILGLKLSLFLKGIGFLFTLVGPWVFDKPKVITYCDNLAEVK